PWLSGMSPAAAAFASACSAPGPPGCDVVLEEVAGRGLLAACVLVAGATLWLEVPQPAAATSANRIAGVRVSRRMLSVSRREPEPRLNASADRRPKRQPRRSASRAP